jgi:hypothetical protein
VVSFPEVSPPKSCMQTPPPTFCSSLHRPHRIEQIIRSVGMLVTHALWLYLILCAALTFMHHLAALHLEQSAESCWKRCFQSRGFIKCQPRCLNFNVTKAAQSHTTYEAVSDTCLHLSYSGMFTSSSLNRCPFKWQCPISSPVIILSWFLFRLRNSPAFLADGF